MTETLTHSTTLVVDTCWCGIGFALPSSLHRQFVENGTTVYCPLGHAVVRKVTEVTKLRAELDQAKADAAHQKQAREANWREVEAERRSHAATKGQLTKTKKRVAGGVCPCCNRTFVDLGRHMAGKHPDFAKS